MVNLNNNDATAAPAAGVALPAALATLTAAAWDRVRALLTKAPKGTKGIRLTLVKGGCAGYEYRVEHASEIQPLDDVIEGDGVKLYVDRAAVLYLLGTHIDYRVGLLESGFVFTNPNESSSCGCGQSVSFRSVAPPPSA